jgi:hypothetical protein
VIRTTAFWLSLLAACAARQPPPAASPPTARADAPASPAPSRATPAPPGASADTATCRPLEDKGCFQVDFGDRSVYLQIPRQRAVTVEDSGVSRTAVPLVVLLEGAGISEPGGWRYKLYASDGFTHGGHATWENLRHGYLEIDTRKVFFEAAQGLPHSFRIKDAYRIELSRP